MVRELLLPLHMKPTAKRFLRFFVTILLPTISNRWAFALIIRVILCCMYNMWQNLINSWQLWKRERGKRKKRNINATAILPRYILACSLLQCRFYRYIRLQFQGIPILYHLPAKGKSSEMTIRVQCRGSSKRVASRW